MTSIESYMREVCNHPTLTDQEEADLARQYAETKAPQLRAKIVEANLRLVVQVARGFTKNLSVLADLIQEGTLGLFEALEKFDSQRGFKFSTYAVYFVRGHMLKFLSENQEDAQLGEDSEQGFVISQDVVEHCNSPASLLEEAHDDHIKSRCRELLSYFEQTLSLRDRAIFKSLWRSEQRLPLREVGHLHGLTKPRIHQIQRQILCQLKTFLGDKLDRTALAAG